MDSLEEVVEARRFVQRFCQDHYPSLALFKFDSGVSFMNSVGEHRQRKPVQHLTTTATCIESLESCPQEFRPPDPERSLDGNRLGVEFARRALQREQHEWTSEGSAAIYCRCRALPLVLRRLPDAEWRTRRAEIRKHLERIFEQLSVDPARGGIGEVDETARRRPKAWYPPNAFHTYFALGIINKVEQRDQALFERLNLQAYRDTLRLWARQHLGFQVALHVEGSASLDTDQLAWAVAIHAKFAPRLASRSEEQDLLNAALKLLFSHQEPSGTWRHHRPLFHYTHAGNAHCYVFETFATLLRDALENRHPIVRAALVPYLGQLIALLSYAERSREPVRDGIDGFGWSSGHVARRTRPEGWATASVYTYAEMLRRLVGDQARFLALRGLKVQAARSRDRADAEETLARRGRTWARDDERTVAEQLFTAFVNPIHAREDRWPVRLEPDHQVFAADQARSAILFGPPGTSKTTIAGAVAGAIGWDYVEIHATDFLSEGLASVHSTADRIFARLMEIDHCVVLFDEVDELVRRRTGEPDASERFLTTAMLPKLAGLWKQRKVLFFVATNHVKAFDEAITRAQRFDLVLFVPPPSLPNKLVELSRILRVHYGIRFRIEPTAHDGLVHAAETALEAMLAQAQPAGERNEDGARRAAMDASLAKLILLRWDQIPELAWQMRCARQDRRRLTAQATLEEGLHRVSDPVLSTVDAYRDFARDRMLGRRDFGMRSTWRLDWRTPPDPLPRSVTRTSTGVLYYSRHGDWRGGHVGRWQLAPEPERPWIANVTAGGGRAHR